MSFPRYPKYKDSGVEWLGEVPEHWEVGAIKHFAQTITDGAHVSPETEGGMYPFVSTKDVLGESIDLEGCLRTSASSYEYMVKTGCKPELGDVLFSKDGTIGRTVVVRHPDDFVVASSLIIIRPKRNLLNPNFLNRLCQSNMVAAQVDSFVKGAGLPRLSIQNLLKVFGCFPPIAEQALIVDFLDREARKIDELVAEQQRLMELLKEKRQAVISHAVTKGLNPRAPMKPSGIEWLGDVPEHWRVVQLGKVCDKVSDGPHFSPQYVDTGVLFLSARNVKVDGWALDDVKYVSEADCEEFDRRVVPQIGDVLYTKGGTTGIARVVDLEGRFQVWVHIAVLKVKQDTVDPHFLAFALNSVGCYEQSQLLTRGATNNDLGLTRMIKIWFVLPPIEEQRQVVAFLRSETKNLDALAAEAQKAIDLLQERRTALISAAVTGQIDVRKLAAA